MTGFKNVCPASVVAWLLLGVVSAAFAARAPDFPAPDKATVTVVGENVSVSGRSMSVREFATTASVAEVVEFYRAYWQNPPAAGMPAVTHEPTLLKPWQLLTRVEDGYLMTVQVKPQELSGSFGYLAIGRVPSDNDAKSLAMSVPALRDSTVLSQVASNDEGKSAETALITNKSSIASNLNFYRNQYASWRKDMDQSLGNAKLHALGYRRGREEVIITIQATEQGGSQIVLNLIEHRGL